MILPNVQKYEFLENNNDNYRALHIAVVKENVLLCPKLGGIYTWWTPKTSPNNETGGWSKLKHIDTPNKLSLWDKKSSDMENHITEIVDNHLDCYLVPMKDVSYSCYETDGVNFNIYVKHDGIFYSTDVIDKKDTLTVVSISKDYCGTLYAFEDNSVVYQNLVPFQTTLDSWMTVDNDGGWGYSLNPVSDEQAPATPSTPKTPPCQRNLMKAFEGNEFNLWTGGKGKSAVMKMMNEHVEAHQSSEESDIELTSGSDEDDLVPDLEDAEIASIVDGELVDSESEYEPSRSSSSSSEQSDYTITTVDGKDQDYYDDSYDEMRQDLNGSWYTRRQFYDHYGSDDAWDNLDPHVFQKMRLDENDGLWYTKEQFYQYYGADVIWKKMHPRKRLVRQSICNAYHWASYLPEQLQHSFLHRYLGSY